MFDNAQTTGTIPNYACQIWN